MQSIILFIIILEVVLFILSLHYHASKKLQYHNDERWILITSKANHICNIFKEIFLAIICSLFIAATLLKINGSISYNRVFLVLYSLIICDTILNTIMLIYYDKQM